MKIIFSLLDQEGELMFDMGGNEYIPKIGSIVAFYDTEWDGDDSFSIEYGSTVDNYFYDISKDELTIFCTVDRLLNDKDNEKISKFNELRNNRNK
jgi:hypothetical protein